MAWGLAATHKNRKRRDTQHEAFFHPALCRDPQQERQLTEWLGQHRDMPGVTMPALQKAQEMYGYLPIEVQRMVADALGIPLAEVYGVATFYSQFRLVPQGRYRVNVLPGNRMLCEGQRKTV